MDRNEKKISNYFGKAPVNGGFAMEDYWVWCGSVIRGEDGLYHMFASRWPKKYPFHPGWGIASEIVRAVSTTTEGPYEFAEVVLPARGAGYWDGRSTHNPVIQKCGDEYLLFYMGTTYPYPDMSNPQTLHHNSPEWLTARSLKRIGIAVSKSVFGPWLRRNQPALDVRPGYFDDFLVSNPAPCVKEDGSCLLIYKTRSYRQPPYQDQNDMFGTMKLGAAWTDHYTRPFTRLTNEPLFSEEEGVLEDPYIWEKDHGYAMIAKDWSGTYTGDVGSVAYAQSSDGVHWEVCREHPAFTREVEWEDGATRIMGNMDRPFLLWEGTQATHLFVATNDGSEAGFRTMTKSYNACIPLTNIEKERGQNDE